MKAKQTLNQHDQDLIKKLEEEKREILVTEKGPWKEADYTYTNPSVVGFNKALDLAIEIIRGNK